MAINVEMLEFSEKIGSHYTLDMSSTESVIEHLRKLLIRDAVPHEERDGATHIYWAQNGNVYLAKSHGHIVNGQCDITIVRAVKRERPGSAIGQRLRVTMRQLDRL